MEKNLEDLMKACELIDEYNSVDVPGLPKIVGLTILTYDGEIITQVPRRIVDDIITAEEVEKNISDLMNSCECTTCDCSDLEERLDKLDEEDEKE